MFHRTTVILPAAGDARWEVWRCGSGSVWQGSADDPAAGSHGGRPVLVALPSRSCRTFAFSAPTDDRQLVRKLAFAQLEKRGLTAAGPADTPFDCHVMEQSDGRSVVSVDVVTPEAAASLAGSKAAAVVPGARLYPIPAGKLVVVEEQGRLVLCAGHGGRLLHSQIVSATRDLNGHAAPEIRIASLALQQQGVLPEVTGVELWGEFSADDAKELGQQLDLPVQAKPRPAPDCQAVRRESSTRLLPPGVRHALRRRRLAVLRRAALAALVLPPAWWMYEQRQKLGKLEAEATRIEATLDIPGVSPADAAEQERLRGDHDLVTAAQTRWTALRMAVDPKRYPVAHLDGLTRCLGAADVVLTRFESKVVEVSVSGTARSAMDAYHYFNAVGKDGPLGVYAWNMAQPSIGSDGSASFELKGKMR
jgi:hypothetical protein